LINVALIDDHELVRLGLVQLLEQESSLSVAFHTSSVSEAIAQLSACSIDVFIIDLTLQGESGFSLLDHLTNLPKSPKTIALSMHDSSSYVSRALEKGVNGYVTKTSAPQELINAIYNVYADKVYLSQSIASRMPFVANNSELQTINNLTDRERQVFDCLAKGMEIKRIASELDIAVKTVHVHRANIMAKLNVHSSFNFTQLALRHGLIEPEALHH
jgi:two-component system, NarL family, response regulator FusR